MKVSLSLLPLLSCLVFARVHLFVKGDDVAATNLRRIELDSSAMDFDEAGNYIPYLHVAKRMEDAEENRRLNPVFGHDEPIEGCVDGNIQTAATATSSGNGGVSRYFGDIFEAPVANNGLYQCEEEYCHSYESSWYPCSETGEIVGENYHYIEAGPGTSTGKWFLLEWPEPQCLCQIWVDTKNADTTTPCTGPLGGDTGKQVAPNRVLNADIQYWDEESSTWITAGSVMDASDDWGFVFPECVSSTKLRLFNVGTGSDTTFQARNPILYELKVYDCESQCTAEVRLCLFVGCQL